MTEHEWLTGADPQAMLECILHWNWHPTRGRVPAAFATPRKLRLFVEACRLAWGREGAYDLDTQLMPAVNVWCLPHLPKNAPSAVQRANLLRCLFGNPWQSRQFGYSMVRTPEGHEVIVTTSSVEQWRSNSTVRAIARAIYDERHFEDMGVLADALEEAGCPKEVECPKCNGRKVEWEEPYIPGLTIRTKINCRMCNKTGSIPNPILAHLRQTERPCLDCGGVGHYHPENPIQVRGCPTCHGTGLLPTVHARGCWVLDLILGKEGRL